MKILGAADIFSEYQLIISAVGGIISFLAAYYVNMRNKNEQIAADALIKRLLPFYNSILKVLNRMDLVGKTEFQIKDFDLNQDIDDLYHTTGQAFFVLTDKSQRQLILNSLQLLEMFNEALQTDFDRDKLNKIRSNIILMLNSIKSLVEEDLMQYRKLGKFKKFKSSVEVDYQRYLQSKDKAILLFTEQEENKKKTGGKT